MRARYEIRIAGRLDERAAAEFADLEVAVRGSVTVIRGEFDQASLHGLLERIRHRPAGTPAGRHRLSRFACRRSPKARVPARFFSEAGERRARSPVGSGVTAGPFLAGPAAARRVAGPRPCLPALAAAIRSARSLAADCRASTATRRLARDKASSKSSAASSAGSVWATSNRSASLRTASRDAFMCFPRFRPGCHDLIRSFPARRALEPAKRPAAVIPGRGERRLAGFHPNGTPRRPKARS